MEGQLGLLELSVISWMFAVKRCPFSGVPLYQKYISPLISIHSLSTRDLRSFMYNTPSHPTCSYTYIEHLHPPFSSPSVFVVWNHQTSSLPTINSVYSQNGTISLLYDWTVYILIILKSLRVILPLLVWSYLSAGTRTLIQTIGDPGAGPTTMKLCPCRTGYRAPIIILY